MFKKRTFVIFAFLFVIMLLISYAIMERIKTNSPMNMYPTEHSIDTIDEIRMETTDRVYSAGVETIVVRLVSEVELGYGMSFELEYYQNDAWYTLEMKDTSFISLAGIVAANLPCDIEYHIKDHYSTPLIAGQYRIVQEFSSVEFGVSYCAAYFVIR